jgi:hypothetical protein
MKLHIANFFDAPRHTAFAGEDIDLGAVIAISQGPSGERQAFQLADGEGAKLVAGNYGVALKISPDQLQVVDSFDVPAAWGTREVTIVSGDAIVQVGRGAILEYDPSLLHSSLDPDRSGNLPAVGAALAVKDGLFCTAATGSAVTSPVVGRVFDVLGGKVRIELV